MVQFWCTYRHCRLFWWWSGPLCWQIYYHLKMLLVSPYTISDLAQEVEQHKNVWKLFPWNWTLILGCFHTWVCPHYWFLWGWSNIFTDIISHSGIQFKSLQDLIATTYIIVVHAGLQSTGMAFQRAAFFQQCTRIFLSVLSVEKCKSEPVTLLQSYKYLVSCIYKSFLLLCWAFSAITKVETGNNVTRLTSCVTCHSAANVPSVQSTENNTNVL